MDLANKNDENDESEAQATTKPLTWDNTTIQCRKLFEVYMEKDHVQTKCVALRAMCGIFMAHPRELFRMNQEGLIGQVMSEASPASIQLEALVCWREILLVSTFSFCSLASKIPYISVSHTCLDCRPRRLELIVVKQRQRWILRRA
jgi:hypothetical protein